jgi:hypothetical protein
MEAVSITRNAKLIKDGEGLYWLALTTSEGSGMFNLSTFVTDPITHEEKSVGFDDVLEAFMREQKKPQTGSQN